MKWPALIACLFVTAIASADRVNTNIHFPGWTIQTSENLWAGSKGTGSYPIWHLLDNRPDTTWCYRGIDYPKPVVKDGIEHKGQITITLSPDKPVEIDELRLMNGYNKSKDVFFKNSSATEIQIFDHEIYGAPTKEDKPIRTVPLSDDLGWKSIRIPKKKYSTLTIRVSRIQKGPIDDLCLSELMIRDGGQDLIQRPKLFTYTPGDDCGCGGEGWLMDWNGNRLAHENEGEESQGTYNASQDLYAASDNKQIWVADLRTAKVVKRIPIQPKTTVTKLEWKANRQLLIAKYSDQQKKPLKPTVIRL